MIFQVIKNKCSKFNLKLLHYLQKWNENIKTIYG